MVHRSVTKPSNRGQTMHISTFNATHPIHMNPCAHVPHTSLTTRATYAAIVSANFVSATSHGTRYAGKYSYSNDYYDGYANGNDCATPGNYATHAPHVEHTSSLTSTISAAFVASAPLTCLS